MLGKKILNDESGGLRVLQDEPEFVFVLILKHVIVYYCEIQSHGRLVETDHILCLSMHTAAVVDAEKVCKFHRAENAERQYDLIARLQSRSVIAYINARQIRLDNRLCQ